MEIEDALASLPPGTRAIVGRGIVAVTDVPEAANPLPKIGAFSLPEDFFAPSPHTTGTATVPATVEGAIRAAAADYLRKKAKKQNAVSI